MTAAAIPTRVLVVDDEPQIRRALDVNLRIRGYGVDLAGTGEDALRLAASLHPDVVILDLGLPGIDGVEVIHGLRAWTDVPIIVLSVREAEAEKVAALDAGADDYVTKPFGMAELLARVRAAVRRNAATDPEEPVVETAAFRVDLAAKRVTTADGGSASRRPNGRSSKCSSETKAGWLPNASCCGKSGAPSTSTKPTTCASTSPTSAASSSRSPPSPATSAPSPAWATASPGRQTIERWAERRPRHRLHPRRLRRRRRPLRRAHRGGQNQACHRPDLSPLRPPTAIRYVVEGHARGKIVITI